MCSSVFSCIHLLYPETTNSNASDTSPLMRISQACQHSMKTPRREALSKAITLLYMVTAGRPAKNNLSHSILATPDGVCLCGREEKLGGWRMCGCFWKHLYKYAPFKFFSTSDTNSTRTVCFLHFFPVQLWFCTKTTVCRFLAKFIASEMTVKGKKVAR